MALEQSIVLPPPVGSILFTGAKVGNVKIEQVFQELHPYFGVILIVLLLSSLFLSTL